MIEDRVQDLENELIRLKKKQDKIIRLFILFSLSITTAFFVSIINFYIEKINIEKIKTVLEILQILGFTGLMGGISLSSKLVTKFKKDIEN